MSNVSSEPKGPRASGFPARGPQVAWGPAAALGLTVLVFMGAQVIAAILLASALGADGDWLDSIAGQFYFVLLSDGLILLMLWAFLRRRRAPLSQLGFGRRPVWLDGAGAVLGYLVYFGYFLNA